MKEILIWILTCAVCLAFLGGMIFLGCRLNKAEMRGIALRDLAMGRTFILNGHIYTSISSTFGGDIECISADGPTQYLSVAAVIALAKTSSP